MSQVLSTILNNSTAIVFDFCGTIADTDKYTYLAHIKALEEYGVKLTYSEVKNYVGSSGSVIFFKLEQDFNIKPNYEEYTNKSSQYFLASVLQSPLMPYNYVSEVLEHFKGKKFYILSSNSEAIISPILKKWNIYINFMRIHSVYDLKLVKENCIKNSRKYFGCEPSEITLFEDSTGTINMAKNYGAKTVLIENDNNKYYECNCDFRIKVAKIF